MKRKIFISLIISFITVLAYNVQALAEIDLTRVTNNAYEDSSPCVKGNYLVWQGHVNGHWQIFLYDIENGGTTQITNNDYNNINPEIDGENVVWYGACNQGEIFLYNITSGETTQITSGTNVDSFPRMANGRVVWTSVPPPPGSITGEISLYDIEEEQQQQLTYNAQDDVSPRINREFVVWLRIDEDDTTLFVYDLFNGEITEAPEDFIWEDNPQTDGDLTVSMRNDGLDWEIIVHENGENGFDQITNNDFNDRDPCISGNNIVWVGGEGNGSEIYLATYAAGEDSGATVVAGEDSDATVAAAEDSDATVTAEYSGDFDGEGKVDGSDLTKFVQNVPALFKFTQKFVRTYRARSLDLYRVRSDQRKRLIKTRTLRGPVPLFRQDHIM